ncbi:translation initiation factor 3 subunit K [Fistulifera solaris]|uniref:Translation initiation factor 3 subunit K n=1 Tax=Fistulifera solaris TaxID=1519565 RepID=A0A1Z5JNG8_FISSO|nr:translation initiation factor 3 subunit K [Fistulifera solaris]|eukprot:GAX15436.1 translation initiation factor 3 subunit K [Fistulifera solaris]
MAPSENDIRTLLNSQSYSSSMVQPLEEYLAAQTAGEAPYLFDAVRTLVKLYQLFPEHSKEDLTVHAYLLAMLEYPSTDNLALSYMIPQPVLSKDVCASIQTCLTHLSACQFAEFWKTYEALESSADVVVAGLAKRSVARLQASILQVLALTFKEAPTSVVSKALRGITAADITALQSPVVQSASADCVVFAASADNTKREKVYQEGVSFSTIGSLLSKISQ